GELGGVGDGHDGHDAGLDGVGDDEIGGVGNGTGHVETDDQQALGADLADSGLDVAAHQRTGQDQGAGAGQAGDGADGVGQGLLTYKGDGIDGDVLAADVVAVGFADSAERDLTDLGAAADDDDALAVDLVQALFGGGGVDDVEGVEVGEERGGVAGEFDFKVRAGEGGVARFERLDREDVAGMGGDGGGEVAQGAGLVG